MKKALKTPKRRALMEELEPRLLLSADLPGVLASAGLMDVDERPADVAVTGLVDGPPVSVVTSAGERPAKDTFRLSQPKDAAEPQRELVFVDAVAGAGVEEGRGRAR